MKKGGYEWHYGKALWAHSSENLFVLFCNENVITKKLLDSSLYFVNVALVSSLCIFDVLLDNTSFIYLIVNCKR